MSHYDSYHGNMASCRLLLGHDLVLCSMVFWQFRSVNFISVCCDLCQDNAWSAFKTRYATSEQFFGDVFDKFSCILRTKTTVVHRQQVRICELCEIATHH